MNQNKTLDVQNNVNRVIKGKEMVVKKVLAATLAGGHILMEDIPGVGKTTLATAFAKTLSLDYKRVQFTPDVLPSDILGFSMYNSATKEFEFRPGSSTRGATAMKSPCSQQIEKTRVQQRRPSATKSLI